MDLKGVFFWRIVAGSVSGQILKRKANFVR